MLFFSLSVDNGVDNVDNFMHSTVREYASGSGEKDGKQRAAMKKQSSIIHVS